MFETHLEVLGLDEQVMSELFFETVQDRSISDFRGERVPEGGGSNTEDSASEGLVLGVENRPKSVE